MTTILVIVGWDRCGSTLVADTLAAAPGVVSIGEVVNLWQRGLADDRLCSCARRFSECGFWQAVESHAFTMPADLVADRAMRAGRRVGNLWLLLSRMPLIGRPLRTRAVGYRQLLAGLYRGIASVAGADVIVDASKTPWHAAIARDIEGFDVRIVHLIRDPRAVAHSLRKRLPYDPDPARPVPMDRHGCVFSSLVWNYRNFLVERFLNGNGRTTTIRYEDFATHPRAVIDDLLAFAGVAPGSIAVSDNGDVVLPTSHNVSGNPRRFHSGPTRIHPPQASWRSDLTPRLRRTVTVLTRRRLRKYGYVGTEPSPSRLPIAAHETVSAVIATRDRPELLRRAIRSVLAQDVPAVAEIVVVFDQSEPDESLIADFPGAPLRIIPNARKPGLPGARNTGIEAARGTWVAFCDDDDRWKPDRLRRQLQLAQLEPAAWFIVGGIEIHHGSTLVVRLPPRTHLALGDFIRSRVMEAHSSTFLIRRAAFGTTIDLVDEDIPHGFAEDYDLLIRAARQETLVAVRAPIAGIEWHQDSYFGNRWHQIEEGLAYLTAKTPEFADDRKGLARIMGQRAFALAASRERRPATRLAMSAIRLDPLTLRPYAALAVASGLVSADRLLRMANATGRGF